MRKIRKSFVKYAITSLQNKGIIGSIEDALKVIAIPLSSKLGIPLTGPVYGGFVCNYKCNLKCIMCDLYKRPNEYKNSEKKLLSYEEMINVLDNFKGIKVSGVGFTGGEPLILDHIEDYVAHAKKLGFLIHLSTNGLNVKEEKFRAVMKNGVSALSISLDGANPKTHNEIRKNDTSFDSVLSSLRIVSKLKKEENLKTVLMSICVINDINYKEVFDIIDISLENGADYVTFSPVHDVNYLVSGKKNDDGVTPKAEKLKSVFETIDKLIELKHKNLPVDNSDEYLKLFKSAFLGKQSPLKCLAGYVSILVDCYGDIFPCFTWMEMNKPIGNIRETSLKKLWRSNKMDDVRKEIENCHLCYWNNQTELNLMFSSSNRKIANKMECKL